MAENTLENNLENNNLNNKIFNFFYYFKKYIFYILIILIIGYIIYYFYFKKKKSITKIKITNNDTNYDDENIINKPTQPKHKKTQVVINENNDEYSDTLSSEINKQLKQIQHEESKKICDQNLTNSEIEKIHKNLE